MAAVAKARILFMKNASESLISALILALIQGYVKDKSGFFLCK
jgi:hypothetical protein